MKLRGTGPAGKTTAAGLCAILLFAPLARGATDAGGFERYRIILDRAPFGTAAVPDDRGPATPPEQDPPAATHLRLTSIVVYGERIRVGLVDEETNRSYVVREDAPEEDNAGFTLLGARLATGEAELRKDGQTFTLRMSTAPIVTPSARSAAAAPQRETSIPRRPPWARRRRSIEGTDRDEATPRRPTREEMEARLRAYREEVERQGLPPLPVPLTVE